MAKTRKNNASMRKTRKQTGGKRAPPKDWLNAVKKVYKELKAKNPKTKLGDALKEASKRKKAGTLY